MITLYAAYNTPFAAKDIVRDIRVMWALEELGMPYTYHWMDAQKGEHKLEPNRSVNPFGKIPSMTDGDVKLFETGAIVHYLYDKAGKMPSDPVERARVLQWMFAALNTVEPPFLDILVWNVFWKDRPGRDIRYPESIENAKQRLADLDRALGTKSFLLGETFGPADIMMATVMRFALHEPSIFDATPRVRAYFERCRARPAFIKAAAKQGVGPDAVAA